MYDKCKKKSQKKGNRNLAFLCILMHLLCIIRMRRFADVRTVRLIMTLSSKGEFHYTKQCCVKKSLSNVVTKPTLAQISWY